MMSAPSSATVSPAAVSPVATLVAENLLDAARQQDAAAALGLADASLVPRAGCKGPGAAAWLEGFGLPIPPQPNAWLPVEGGGGRIARLGATEFLIEGPAALVQRIAAAPRAPGVYPVLRQDLAIVAGGARLPELLRQTCSVDFDALDPAARPVVLTSMVGVGVTVIPETLAGRPACRIWCDGTFGHYFWETLLGIAHELDGGAVSPDRFD